ncbi:DUF3638 protein [Fadolivirus algeromassiliense]|jgi:hypothetical protein|uniref:ubiquitinyl hydrolase 1 n=1 Tax=Fadolivirus FV1/VV64 TaxID=3070911 RepID=A0A7D3V923_9VIRU|nr:DUF3638 protein [Fadolivirus algeromassiliense]QKF94457.1 DUF3638 protein [Fadolivirus FV1/VV64]
MNKLIDITNPFNDRFTIHFLFDAYIAENLGSPSIIALQKFHKSFQLLNDPAYNNIISLFSESIKVEREKNELLKILENNYQNKKYFINNNDAILYFNKITLDLIDQLKNIVTLNPDIFKNKMPTDMQFSSDKINEILNEIIIKAFIVEKYLSKQEIFLPSGYWNKKKDEGHLVGIYLKRTGYGTYTVVITNSGEGINVYHQKLYEKYECIVEINGVSPYDIISILYNDMLANGLYDNEYTIDKYYSNVVLQFKSPFTSSQYNINYYKLPQLSGSCTFYGIYHNISYILPPELFIKWNDTTKARLVSELGEWLVEKTSSEIIGKLNEFNKDVNIKNYIDILQHQYKNQLGNTLSTKLYNNYKVFMDNYCEISGTTPKISYTTFMSDQKPVYKSDSILLSLRNHIINSITITSGILRLNTYINSFPTLNEQFYRADLFYLLINLSNREPSFYYVSDVGEVMDNLHKILQYINDKQKSIYNPYQHYIFYKLLVLHLFIKVNDGADINSKRIKDVPDQPSHNAVRLIINFLNRNEMWFNYYSYYDFNFDQFVYNLARYIDYFPNIKLGLKKQLHEKFILKWGNLNSGNLDCVNPLIYLQVNSSGYGSEYIKADMSKWEQIDKSIKKFLCSIEVENKRLYKLFWNTFYETPHDYYYYYTVPTYETPQIIEIEEKLLNSYNEAVYYYDFYIISESSSLQDEITNINSNSFVTDTNIELLSNLILEKNYIDINKLIELQFSDKNYKNLNMYNFRFPVANAMHSIPITEKKFNNIIINSMNMVTYHNNLCQNSDILKNALNSCDISDLSYMVIMYLIIKCSANNIKTLNNDETKQQLKLKIQKYENKDNIFNMIFKMLYTICTSEELYIPTILSYLSNIEDDERIKLSTDQSYINKIMHSTGIYNYINLFMSDIIFNKNQQHIFTKFINDEYSSTIGKLYDRVIEANKLLAKEKKEIILDTDKVNFILKLETGKTEKITIFSTNRTTIPNVIANNYLFYHYTTSATICYGIPIKPLMKQKIKLYNQINMFLENENGYRYIDIKHLPPSKLKTFIEKLNESLSNKNIANPEILLWMKEDEYMIELPLYSLYGSNEILVFKYVKDKIYYKDYEIITSHSNVLLTKFIYGIRNSLLLQHSVNENDRKVLLINNVYNTDILCNTIWNNKKGKIKKIVTESYGKLYSTNYYIIDIHYTGLYLLFNDVESFWSYFIACLFNSKNDCLNIIINQALQYYNIEHKSKEFIKIIHEHALYNTPYKYYYNYRFNTLFHRFDVDADYKDNTRFDDRIAYYPNKYIMKEPTNKSLINYTYNFTNNKMPLLISEPPKLSTIVAKETINIASIENEDFRNCLNDFIKQYRSCTTKGTYDIGKIEKSKTEIIKKIQSIYSDIYDKLEKIHHETNIFIESISNSTIIQILYNLIEYNILLNTANQMLDICKKNCDCNEILKLRDSLDTDIIYNGSRTYEILIFEIMFGSFIRKDQYELYSRIANEKDKYYVYQMLMGKGKTSVITPLLMFKNIFNPKTSNINNTILILPNHLIEQSFSSILKYYSYMMDNIYLSRLMIGRNEDTDALYSHGFVGHYNSILKIPRLIQMNNIIVMDDISLKSIKLNNIITEDKSFINNNRIKYMIQNNSFLIMDEIDSMINPLSSDLNFPIEPEESIPNAAFIFPFCANTIKKILEKDKKEIIFETINESKTNIINFFKKYNYEGEYKNEYQYFINKYITTTPYDSKNVKWEIVGVLRKILQTLITSLTMVYNKDYGFGTIIEKQEKNSFVAIPFKAVNSPDDGSEFSDPELTIILTTFTYYYSGLKKENMVSILTYCKQIMKDTPEIWEVLLDKYILIFKNQGINLDETVNCLNDEVLENVLGKLNKNYELIENYLVDILFPKYIKKYSQQYNSSFLDVMTNNFTTHKTAFSGTVNIDIPRKEENGYNNEFQLIKTYDLITNKLISTKSAEEDPIANGEIVSAFLGYTQSPYSKCYHMKDDLVEIARKMIEHNYNVLIDTGAFFKQYSNIEVIKKIIEIASTKPEYEQYTKKSYIYLDEKDKPFVYSDIDGLITNVRFKNELIDSEKIFIYYDHKHIVGIDIKQPYFLRGFATINYFNMFTDVSQGIFRLRKLNYGHTIDFILHKYYANTEKVNNSIELLNVLWRHEQTNKKNSYYKFLIQNIKLLHRIHNKTKAMYIDKIYYETIKNEADLSKDMFSIFVAENYCKSYPNEQINKLCSELTEIFKTSTVTQNNVQKQLEKTKEKVKEQAMYFTGRILPNIQVDLRHYIKTPISEYLLVNISNYSKICVDTRLSILQKNNIFISPYLLKLMKNNFNLRFPDKIASDKDYFEKYINYDPNPNAYFDNYVVRHELFLKNFPFYYIIRLDGSNSKFLIITPEEYINMKSYLSIKQSHPIIIKNKFGKVVYPPKQHHQASITFYQELLIKLLTVTDLTINEYLILFRKIITNNQINEFGELMKTFRNLYQLNYASKDFEAFFISNGQNYINVISAFYNSNDYDALLKICGFDTSGLTTSQKKKIVESNDIFGKIVLRQVDEKPDASSILNNIEKIHTRRNIITTLLNHI